MGIRFWWVAHSATNRLAWRFAKPPGPVFGSALRIDRRRWLWRLNQWCADHYVPRLIAEGCPQCHEERP